MLAGKRTEGHTTPAWRGGHRGGGLEQHFPPRNFFSNWLFRARFGGGEAPVAGAYSRRRPTELRRRHADHRRSGRTLDGEEHRVDGPAEGRASLKTTARPRHGGRRWCRGQNEPRGALAYWSRHHGSCAATPSRCFGGRIALESSLAEHDEINMAEARRTAPHAKYRGRCCRSSPISADDDGARLESRHRPLILRCPPARRRGRELTSCSTTGLRSA